MPAGDNGHLNEKNTRTFKEICTSKGLIFGMHIKMELSCFFFFFVGFMGFCVLWIALYFGPYGITNVCKKLY